MEIIAEYRRLTRELAVVNSKIKSKERELNKIVDAYAPAGCKALDYSKPQVQSNRHVPDIVDLAGKIYDINGELVALRKERDEIMAQRDELDKCIDSLGDMPAKAMMLRIKGYNNRQIAYEIGYTRRHVERLISEARTNLANL